MFFASLFSSWSVGLRSISCASWIHLAFALVGYLLWGILLGYLGWIDPDISCNIPSDSQNRLGHYLDESWAFA
jgi:hypothetical protein